MTLRFLLSAGAPVRSRIGMVAAAFLLACGAQPASASAREDAAAPPSALSKTLRALGVEAPPAARGDKAYRRGDYEEALRQYGKAVEETPPGAPARKLLDLNIGNALYRQKRWPEAADSYDQALKRAGNDSGFSARAHHNLGNAFYRKAETADSTPLEAALADAREAVAHYKKALRMDSRSPRSKRNLEQANALLQRLQQKQQQQQQQQGEPPKPPEPSARAKEALARALQLTQEGRYAEAVAVLNEIMKVDRTAASFSAHLQRLDDVRKILRGETPAPPGPEDPRATPWTPGAPGSAGPAGRRAP